MTVTETAARALDALLDQVRACRLCEPHLPLGARPVLQAGHTARLLIVGQAPGTKVHRSGIPWHDASGERLRNWLGIDRTIFYDRQQVAIIPMGLCYPGRGTGGDLPPRPECAPRWHPPLLAQLPAIELTLAIGQYAQRALLGGTRKDTLTATVAAFREYPPHIIPLPHPSPRNIAWFQRNPWFEQELVPALRQRIHLLLQPPTSVLCISATPDETPRSSAHVPVAETAGCRC